MLGINNFFIEPQLTKEIIKKQTLLFNSVYVFISVSLPRHIADAWSQGAPRKLTLWGRRARLWCSRLHWKALFSAPTARSPTDPRDHFLHSSSLTHFSTKQIRSPYVLKAPNLHRVLEVICPRVFFQAHLNLITNRKIPQCTKGRKYLT